MVTNTIIRTYNGLLQIWLNIGSSRSLIKQTIALESNMSWAEYSEKPQNNKNVIDNNAYRLTPA